MQMSQKMQTIFDFYNIYIIYVAHNAEYDVKNHTFF